jgi:predicted nuclease of predicted toxin-antitoxin system
MKLLVDNTLSPVLAELLRKAGHEAVHCQRHRLASRGRRGHLRAGSLRGLRPRHGGYRLRDTARKRSISRPSLILFRGEGSRKPEALAVLLLSNLAQLTDALTTGCIVIFKPARLRVRPLPISN